MTEPGRLIELKTMTWKGSSWDSKDKPVVVTDSGVRPLSDIQDPIEEPRAYVVGLSQKHFELACDVLRDVRWVHFYEMRVGELEPIAGLRSLRHLAIRWNTKVSSLEPLRSLERLRTLVIEDTPKVRDLDPIGDLASLEALEFSGGMWNAQRPESLEPLGRLRTIEALRLFNVKVGTDGLRPLERLKTLRTLEVSNQFDTADYAFLSVRLPNTVCSMFAPFVRRDFSGRVGDQDVMVVGKGKPFLNSTTDAQRLAGYVRRFEALQRGFAEELP